MLVARTLAVAVIGLLIALVVAGCSGPVRDDPRAVSCGVELAIGCKDLDP